MARIKDRLTAAAVKAAQHAGQDVKLFDGGGLFLHIQPKAKYWRLKYRCAGKEKLLALGVYPDVSLKEAREERDKAKRLLASGVDPVAARRAEKDAIGQAGTDTVEVMCREWWETTHRKQVMETHSRRNLRRLEQYVFPDLGRRPIASVTSRELLAALRQVADTGKVETAHRVLSLCSQVWRYAVTTGRAERDITTDLRRALPTAPEKHHPALISPEDIAPLLRAIDGFGGYPATLYALQLAPLLFVRPGELRKAEWKDFDLDQAVWNLTPSKGGDPLVVPLSRQAAEILRKMQMLSGRERYVFPSARGGGRPMSENTLNAALHTLGFKGTMTAHGFRALARTVLVERLGYPADWVEQQLAHSVRDPLGRAYNRTTFLPQRREMMQAWAEYLDKLRQGGAEGHGPA
jgi:integrase